MVKIEFDICIDKTVNLAKNLVKMSHKSDDQCVNYVTNILYPEKSELVKKKTCDSFLLKKRSKMRILGLNTENVWGKRGNYVIIVASQHTIIIMLMVFKVFYCFSAKLIKKGAHRFNI